MIKKLRLILKKFKNLFIEHFLNSMKPLKAVFLQFSFVKAFIDAYKKSTECMVYLELWEPNYIRRFDEWDKTHYRLVEKGIQFTFIKPILVHVFNYSLKENIAKYVVLDLNICGFICSVLLVFYFSSIIFFRIYNWHILLNSNSSGSKVITLFIFIRKLPSFKFLLLFLVVVLDIGLFINFVHHFFNPEELSLFNRFGIFLKSHGIGPNV